MLESPYMKCQYSVQRLSIIMLKTYIMAAGRIIYHMLVSPILIFVAETYTQAPYRSNKGPPMAPTANCMNAPKDPIQAIVSADLWRS